jgi:hypothetical protein
MDLAALKGVDGLKSPLGIIAEAGSTGKLPAPMLDSVASVPFDRR